MSLRDLDEFGLEIYFAKYEFTAKYLLCCSDMETISMKELLLSADEECKLLWDELRLGYTETKGLPILRKEIAKQHYNRLTSENILCFSGAEEGIYCFLNSFIKPIDHVIVITPCYQSLLSIPTALAQSTTSLDLVYTQGNDCDHDDNDSSGNGSTWSTNSRWTVNISALKSEIRPNTRLIIMNFPHNPTGCTLLQSELEEIIAVARETGIYVFSDEVYRGLEDDSFQLPTVASVYEKGISLGVVSKVRFAFFLKLCLF